MSFDVAAEAYDRFMGRYSAPLAVGFADWVGVRPGMRALDVGCGPGALAAVIADRLGAPAVTAVDPSETFVVAARRRLPGVDVRLATAEALPFDDSGFDVTLASLVVHFMTDPAAGVGEMVRVTRPGGVVATCVWDFAGGRAPQSLFFQALREVAGDIDDETARAGAAPGQLAALLIAAGCRGVESGEVTVTLVMDSFGQWWEPYTLGVAPAGRQLARLDDDAREQVRRRCRELVGDGPLTMLATAWVARGTV